MATRTGVSLSSRLKARVWSQSDVEQSDVIRFTDGGSKKGGKGSFRFITGTVALPSQVFRDLLV
jgi:hypothetical protein